MVSAANLIRRVKPEKASVIEYCKDQYFQNKTKILFNMIFIIEQIIAVQL